MTKTKNGNMQGETAICTWIYPATASGAWSGRVVCSNCKANYKAEFGEYTIWNHCPNCGAKVMSELGNLQRDYNRLCEVTRKLAYALKNDRQLTLGQWEAIEAEMDELSVDLSS